jgi:Ca2+-binding EF-hand superfamily protein
MKGRYVIFSALVIAAGSVYAGSQSTESEMFRNLDQDQNGAISQQEASKQQTLSQDWAKYDTNQDGQINASEFSAFEMEQKEPTQPQK